MLSSYTKNTRVSPSSVPSSLYEFSFSTERARWSVAESMRQDRRALSRDNIIILYGHASHAWKLRVRAKALRRKEEEEEEVGNRGPTMSRGGPPICLPNNRRLDLVAVKTTSNNRPFFRAAERKDEGTSTRAPFDRTVVQSQSVPIVLRYHESSIYVLTNWKYLFRGYCREY